MEKFITDRLTIREASSKDDLFIFNLLNSHTWIEHIGDRNIKNLTDAKQYINNSLISSYRENGFGLFIMELTNSHTPIGLCGFLKRDELEHVDIGFAVLPEHAGNGYTFEAADRIIKESEFSVIYGITYEGNLGSRKLLKKLGLKYVRNFQFSNYEEESMLFSNEVH